MRFCHCIMGGTSACNGCSNNPANTYFQTTGMPSQTTGYKSYISKEEIEKGMEEVKKILKAANRLEKEAREHESFWKIRFGHKLNHPEKILSIAEVM